MALPAIHHLRLVIHTMNTVPDLIASTMIPVLTRYVAPRCGSILTASGVSQVAYIPRLNLHLASSRSPLEDAAEQTPPNGSAIGFRLPPCERHAARSKDDPSGFEHRPSDTGVRSREAGHILAGHETPVAH